MSGIDTYERVSAADRAEWRAWLTARHAETPGVWLVYARKGSGLTSVRYEEAVEEALCFGWIDSLTRRLDEAHTLQLFTPRKRRSPWAASNRERVARLIEQGLMAPSGLAAVAVAMADGTWLASVRAANLSVPDDLAAALAANPDAQAHFAAFSQAVRQQSLAWIADAKQDATRQRRIARVVQAAAEGRNPRAQPPRENARP